MRPERFKYVGYIFSIITIVNLLLSQKGMEFSKNLFTIASTQTSPVYDFLAPLVAVVSLLITSEAMGYILTSLAYIWWNKTGGYSSEWRKCSYNIKDIVLIKYSKIDSSNQIDKCSDFSEDVFLSYFWQRADRSLVEWVSRRHTIFFTGISAFVGFACALLVSWIVILNKDLVWHTPNWIFLIISGALMAIILYNANFERKTARQMVDLWLSTLFNAHMQSITKEIEAQAPKQPISGGQLNKDEDGEIRQ